MTQQPGATSLAGSPLPRITIVTPATSGDEPFDATLRSTSFQDYPNLEFIVIEDGTSSERRRILKKYEAHLSWQLCPPATELCAALNMAFAKSSGEILGWLEPGDMLHTNSLYVIGSVFASLPNIEWITGRPFSFSPNGMPTGIKHLERWSRIRFLAGGNKYIHRDTTFWRRTLWERAGGSLATEYGLAAALHSCSPTFLDELVISSHVTSLRQPTPIYCDSQSHRILSPQATS